MGYRGQTFRISLDKVSFNANKNFDAVPANSLISGSKNVVLHEGGVGKRGGTIPMHSTALTGSPDINGLYQFKTSSGSSVLICGTSAGDIISDPTGTPVTRKSGLVTNSIYDFMTYNDDCYIVPYSANTTVTTIPAGTNWTAQTLPATRNWNAVAWNSAVFCAVAAGTDKCATSPDGVTWTERTLPASRNWAGIAWNGTVFCAVASGPTDKCATSPDGTTWTERTLPASRNWAGIAWNGTVFCAVALGTDKCATSPDGTTWTERTLPATRNWYAIAWNSTVFCAVAINDGADTNKCATSPDGITWTERTMAFSGSWWGIAWNSTVFCAVDYGTNKCATSPDGTTWTERTLPATRNWAGIAAGNGYFVAIAGSSKYGALSQDGITWSQIEFPTSASRYGIAYSNSTYGFAVVDNNTNDANTSVASTLGADPPQKWDGADTLTTSIGIPTPPTAALAGLGAGNVNAGAHTYKTTFVTSSGETSGSNASNSVTTTAGDGQVNVTDIQLGPTGTTSRKLYRTEAGGSTYKLLATIADNTTTTYADNIADGSLGATIPATNTAATIPSDWGTYYPKQLIVHGYGNSERVWAFGTPTKSKWIYITPNNDGASDADFSQANILTLYIETGDGYGLVGGAAFKDRMIAFGRRKAYIIDDTDINTDNWGYVEAPWEGGAASYRVIVQTPNDIIVMGDDGEIYSVTAAQQFGESKLASIIRPYHIHVWINDNIDLSYIEKFHGIYDPVLRAVKFWMVRKGQSECDTCLSYYVDLGIWGPPEDNLTYASGFNAASSTLVKLADNTYNVYTGDYSGFIWQLNQSGKHDNNNGYEGTFRLPHLTLEQDEVGLARYQKHFDTGRIIGTPQSGVNLTGTIYVDGEDYTTETISLTDVGSTGQLDKDFPIGMSGKRISPKFSNSTATDDFFVSQITIDFRNLGAAP